MCTLGRFLPINAVAWFFFFVVKLKIYYLSTTLKWLFALVPQIAILWNVWIRLTLVSLLNLFSLKCTYCWWKLLRWSVLFFLTRLLLSTSLLGLPTLRPITRRRRPLNLLLNERLMIRIARTSGKTNFIMALRSLFRHSLASSNNLLVRVLKVIIGRRSQRIILWCSNSLIYLGCRSWWYFCYLSGLVVLLICSWFAHTICCTIFTNDRLCVQNWRTIFLSINTALICLILGWSNTMLSIRFTSRYSILAGCDCALFVSLNIVWFVANWLVCLLDAWRVTLFFSWAFIVSLASFRFFSAVFDGFTSWI